MNKQGSIEKEFCFSFSRKSGISYSLFEDVAKKSQIDFLSDSFLYKRDFFSRLRNKIRLLNAGRKIINLNKYKGKTVFLTNETLSVLSEKNFLKIKSVAKHIVLFFIDEFFNEYDSMKRAKEYYHKYADLFDLVYTFSKTDANKYKMRWCMKYYHKRHFEKETDNFDLFFIGNIKDRKQELCKLQEILEEKNVNCRFIVNASAKEKLPSTIIKASMPYAECVKNVIASNCVLDLPDSRQCGMTLRYFEAVVYNKKLLTTNKNVKNTPYYNERYMKIIEKAEDVKGIDEEWFKNADDVDYQYQGEYETKLFLEQILCDLDNIKGC